MNIYSYSLFLVLYDKYFEIKYVFFFKNRKNEWMNIYSYSLFLVLSDKHSEIKNVFFKKNRNCELFTWVIQWVFKGPELYCFAVIERLENYFLSIVLMENKYPLHNINEG
jgi:hypothetical protein